MFSPESIVIPPNSQKLLSISIDMEILQPHHYGQLKSCSGLALKHQIYVPAGVIYSDYNGEKKILLYNESSNSYIVNQGSHTVQLVIFELPDCNIT